MDITHIMIPYQGTNEEQELLQTVCRIARCFRAKVSIIHVLEVPMNLELDTEALPGLDEANALLDQAEDIARSVGVKATSDLLQARDAGHAIVEEASERGVDLILMEARQEIQLGMLTLGRTVDYVVKHAHCVVWVSRFSAESPDA